MKHDWKKAEKHFYSPKDKPEKVTVPEFAFFTLEGQGDPNNAFFNEYISVLYSLSYGVKMSPRKNLSPPGYFEYAVYPLEGVWDLVDRTKSDPQGKIDKDNLKFTLMIRQPDFVTPEFARTIIEITGAKKPHPLLSQVRFEKIKEGPCVQMLHVGSYDDEPKSFAIMEQFCADQGLVRKSKVHREIYLSDARKTVPEKLKTILRFQIIEGE